MSHLVKSLARSVNILLAEKDYADWVHDVYSTVGLTAVLDGILRMAAGDMPPNHAQQVFEMSVHGDVVIRSFVTNYECSCNPAFRNTKEFGLGQDHRLDPAVLCTPSGNDREACFAGSGLTGVSSVRSMRAQYMKDDEDDLPSPPLEKRFGTKSPVTPSGRIPSSDDRQTSAGTSRGRPTASYRYPARRLLNSTVRQVLRGRFKFRILVVGKSRSGKSSLIKAVFQVDATAESKDTRGKTDINVEFHPEDNRYLIIHECSVLESQPGDSQNLQTIRDFVSHRTDASRSPSEWLHAVWICVPASDAITGSFGEGVEDILNMRTVPVILVLTKFDMIVREICGDVQEDEHARARVFAMCEDSCRRLFNKDLRDVPVEIVSEKPRYVDLIERLVVTTDRFIMGAPGPLMGFGNQGEQSRVSAVPLAWSAALRVSRGIIIQTSIEVGRSGYWPRLWSSVDFADHALQSCVNIIHVDLVETWNHNDKTRYLESDEFKAKMSHLVKDLAGSGMMSDHDPGSPYPTEAGVEFADWVHDVYRGSQENVRCVMGYIVDLTVILYAISSTTSGNISPESVLSVIDRHVRSGRRNRIHRDIRRFVAEASIVRFSVPQKDLILERIIDLIQEYCVPPARTG
ncbi:hypothetical protein EDB92DRAFT_1944025 [Lactarius akahatsu]|uniref:G domain-containing protein n=1 Tax=Lactarius akahatsu TaxID=416441 RepID=A0AAD4LKC4_9AGAM|nr:hypothetical protein EDB92DRAFT_1944025 [Lactarius akahatsu]